MGIEEKRIPLASGGYVTLFGYYRVDRDGPQTFAVQIGDQHGGVAWIPLSDARRLRDALTIWLAPLEHVEVDP